jgi:single-strand DNA-binding protein
MNRAIIKGRITKDIEVRYSSNQVAMCNFTVAVDRKFKKEGEEKQADFIPCKAFGKSAEFLGKYFQKGSDILLEGRLQSGSYEKDGVKHYTLDVIVEQVEFCGKKSENANRGDSYEPSGDGFYQSEDQDDQLPF